MMSPPLYSSTASRGRLVSALVLVSLLLASSAQALTWGEVLQAQCQGRAPADCDVTIPENEVVELSANAEAASVLVKGRLAWSTTSPAVLSAGFVVADGPQGTIQIGSSSSSPAAPGSGVYIRNNGRAHPVLGKRSFGSYGSGASFHVHGQEVLPWTLLTQTAWRGHTQIVVRDDVSAGGWKVGDRIVIAPTTSYPRRGDDSRAEAFTITNVSGNVVQLDRPVDQSKAGYPDRRVQAEVIHMTRSVLITGDDFDGQGHGLHTVAHSGAIGRVEYARVEKGGQHGVAGKYPLHFHLAGSTGICPECRFVGNAIESSSQRGIIIHGTHRSLVDSNVLFDLKGSYIYVEDGNEMENIISRNVGICPSKNGCKTGGTDNGNADDIHQSGIWALSVSNDFIENRLVNHNNGIFTQTSAFPHGRGFAAQRVCTMYAPVGKIKGNVCHSNVRFGFYMDNNFPRNVKRSVETNGLITPEDFHAHVDGNPATISSCDAFTADGEDNGRTAIVEDQLEVGNDFSGQYALGDVQFLRWHAINNLHGIYWKETKQMASTTTVDHIKDSTFEWIGSSDHPELRSILGSPEGGVAAIAGPGGLGAFKLTNTAFIGSWDAAVAANQHCGLTGTGGMCTPEYQLTGIDWSRFTGRKRIQFGISTGNTVLPFFTTTDGSLGGYSSIASQAQAPHLLGLSQCQRIENQAQLWDNGIGCSEQLRRLQIWSGAGNQGAVLVGPNNQRWNMEFIGPPTNNPRKQGFGAAVLPGETYQVELDRDDRITVTFSEPRNPQQSLTLQMRFRSQPSANRQCTISSTHSRKWINSNGPVFEGQGACTAEVAEPIQVIDVPPQDTTDPPEDNPPNPPTADSGNGGVDQGDEMRVCFGRTAAEREVEASCDANMLNTSPNINTGEGFFHVDMRCTAGPNPGPGCIAQTGCRICHVEMPDWTEDMDMGYPLCPACVCQKWQLPASACVAEAPGTVADETPTPTPPEDSGDQDAAPDSDASAAETLWFEDFEQASDLSNWYNYVNTYTPALVWSGWYGNTPVPQSSLMTMDGDQWLNTYSNYDDAGHASGSYIENNYYRGLNGFITADMQGRFEFSFTARAPNQFQCGGTNVDNGASGGLCHAFVKVIDSNDFSLRLYERIETTSVGQGGETFVLSFDLGSDHVGHIFQVGFMNLATGYAPTGMLYDDVSLRSATSSSDSGPVEEPPAPLILGCTDPNALNFDPTATQDDGNCVMPVDGCTNPNAINFNPDANVDDGSCIDPMPGCTNTNSINFNPDANLDDGSCIDPMPGCTNTNSINFNPDANLDDGSCMCSCSCDA